MARSEPEIVVTPSDEIVGALVRELGCRTTVGVLVQLIAESRSEVLLASPFLSGQPGVVGTDAIYAALESALRRGVRVSLFSTGQGLDSADASGLQSMSDGRLHIYQPRANIEDSKRLGSHAKVCISDATQAYVGSANLTGPGLVGNFELGVRLRGEVAARLRSLWMRLIDSGLFVPIG